MLSTFIFRKLHLLRSIANRDGSDPIARFQSASADDPQAVEVKSARLLVCVLHTSSRATNWVWYQYNTTFLINYKKGINVLSSPVSFTANDIERSDSCKPKQFFTIWFHGRQHCAKTFVSNVTPLKEGIFLCVEEAGSETVKEVLVTKGFTRERQCDV